MSHPGSIYGQGVWREGLACEIKGLSYNFDTRTARFFLPAEHCTDMRGAINFAKMIDKKVREIEIVAGGNLINIYSLKEKDWHASSYERHPDTGVETSD